MNRDLRVSQHCSKASFASLNSATILFRFWFISLTRSLMSWNFFSASMFGCILSSSEEIWLIRVRNSSSYRLYSTSVIYPSPHHPILTSDFFVHFEKSIRPIISSSASIAISMRCVYCWEKPWLISWDSVSTSIASPSADTEVCDSRLPINGISICSTAAERRMAFRFDWRIVIADRTLDAASSSFFV